MTTTPPPAWAIEAAAAALARAEIFDDRVTSDRARMLVWAEALTKYGIEKADAMSAVTAHYQQAGADTPKPGDIIEHARKIRRERAEHEKGRQAALTPSAAPDAQLGHLPIDGADGKPVWPAYEQHDAIEHPCRTCGAVVHEGCVNTSTGMDRKIPCVSRLIDGARAARA